MTSRHTADQTEIRDLTARFTDAVNRRAPGELADLFAEDGEWHVPGVPEATGREAVSALLENLLGNFPHLIQLTHSGHVDVSGDTATATWYLTESGADASGNGFDFTGVYTDSLVRTEDGWRFARRSFAFLRRTRSEAKARWYPHPRSAA
ncbi:nuclear transport factor 2 family protein [Thermobifida halotolerans]|uniref:Nuclear transport factor 2 family protein n=1 Tax=Thermobifida halotolerans TaxID=483545 RepID=A0AA97M597_9ACTN|nr:nuclear transport factor 2 family protein [Thermobifida halotolerans]UOE21224.1 nuclear transport factor 2 family protein [Thermobifida halotolerans]